MGETVRWMQGRDAFLSRTYATPSVHRGCDAYIVRLWSIVRFSWLSVGRLHGRFSKHPNQWKLPQILGILRKLLSIFFSFLSEWCINLEKKEKSMIWTVTPQNSLNL